jgi:hypothetical protein
MADHQTIFQARQNADPGVRRTDADKIVDLLVGGTNSDNANVRRGSNQILDEMAEGPGWWLRPLHTGGTGGGQGPPDQTPHYQITTRPGNRRPPPYHVDMHANGTIMQITGEGIGNYVQPSSPPGAAPGVMGRQGALNRQLQEPGGENELVVRGRGRQGAINRARARRGQGGSIDAGGIVVIALAVGALFRWLHDYIDEEKLKAELGELESRLLQRAAMDPRLGVLVVVTFEHFQPRDAPDEIVTYRGLDEFYAQTVGQARADARSIGRGLPPGSDIMHYTYHEVAWIPPLHPAAPDAGGASSEADPEAVQPWYGRYQSVQNALKRPEPDYVEAFNVLNGSSMYDILRVLERFRLRGELKWLYGKLPFAKGINVSRLRAAFDAVSGRADETTTFDNYKLLSRDYGQLDGDQQKDIQAFFSTNLCGVRSTLAGLWRVQVKTWTWHYDFDRNGWVRWTDRMNNMTGTGSWTWSGSRVRISWDQSRTTEEWAVPLDTANQSGMCRMQEGLYPLRATKVA